jgi:hypothetical protein
MTRDGLWRPRLDAPAARPSVRHPPPPLPQRPRAPRDGVQRSAPDRVGLEPSLEQQLTAICY